MKERRKSGLAQRELWIGLAKVVQSSRRGVLGDCEGAYTNAIAIADRRGTFRREVKEALAELGLRLIRLEDAEPLNTRLSKYSVDPELRQLAKEVSKSGMVGFDTFQAFERK